MDEREQMEKLKESYRSKRMTEAQKNMLLQSIEKAKRKKKQTACCRRFGAVAALLALFVILPNASPALAHAMANIPLLGNLVTAVTWTEYQYQDERNQAQVSIPEVAVNETSPKRSAGIWKDTADGGSPEILKDTADGGSPEILKDTAEEINREIQGISQKLVSEFEEVLANKEGYQNMELQWELIHGTEQYFTLKLTGYYASADSAEWNYYYSIDLETGNRLKLDGIFQEDSNYIEAISQDIKRQMREQMSLDDNMQYWLDSSEEQKFDFLTITEETQFYIDAEGRLVICFQEGEVAPMYMGAVSFVIGEEALEGKWKENPHENAEKR